MVSLWSKQNLVLVRLHASLQSLLSQDHSLLSGSYVASFIMSRSYARPPCRYASFLNLCIVSLPNAFINTPEPCGLVLWWMDTFYYFQIQKRAPFTAVIQIGTDRTILNITLNVSDMSRIPWGWDNLGPIFMFGWTIPLIMLVITSKLSHL